MLHAAGMGLPYVTKRNNKGESLLIPDTESFTLYEFCYGIGRSSLYYRKKLIFLSNEFHLQTIISLLFILLNCS